MKSTVLPFALALCVALSGCGPEDSAKPEPKKDAAAPVSAADAENARLEAIRQDCLKRPRGPAAEGAALPVTDGLYRLVPRDKTYSSTWWLSNARSVLLAEPREGSGVTATLPPQTWVEVAEDIAFVIPKRGVVLEGGQGFDLTVCDVVYQIDSEDGEGASTKYVWRQGRVFSIDSNDGHAGAEGMRAPYIEWDWSEGETPLSPSAAARLGPWVRVKGPGGAEGWVRGGAGDFDCIWENDRYLDNQPTKCAKYPGAPAEPATGR
jgi:hypothetical protein